MDFTISTYRKLINTLQQQGFSFLPIEEFVSNQANKVVVLRHDVDSLPGNSLKFAKIQAEKGIKGTYYFRIVSQSYNEQIIKEIYSLGHEIGYHYETMDTCKGNVDKAYSLFCQNLEKLRQLVPVHTICMHGSPLSKFDNCLIWHKYDYHKLGIIAEPYFDINFDEVLYLTDTGRRWDGGSVNIRDKASGDRHQASGKKMNGRGPAPCILQPATFPKFHSTFDIIKAANEGLLPDKIMMTFHPQRWTDKPLPWVKELVWQNVKNVGKYFLVKAILEK